VAPSVVLVSSWVVESTCERREKREERETESERAPGMESQQFWLDAAV
jgi:hypothetical protein